MNKSDPSFLFPNRRITRPPGGVSSIFTESGASPDSDAARDARDSLSPSRPYRMASNFELGDEQPSQEEIEAKQGGASRRRSKPSGEHYKNMTMHTSYLLQNKFSELLLK